MGSAAGVQRIVVRYTIVSERPTREDSAAIAWLAGHPGLTVEIARLTDSHIPPCDVLWLHLPDSVSYEKYLDQEKRHHVLATFAAGRGSLLCTGYGAFIANDLGCEPARPSVRFDTLVNDWLWDKKGFQSFRGHPLLAGLFGGDYVWDARTDQILPIIGYYNDSWPQHSNVVAVEKSYVFMHSRRRIVTECRRDNLRILAIGGFVYFAPENNQRHSMERFVDNAIQYLSKSTVPGPVTFWRPSDGVARSFSFRSSPLRVSPKRSLSGVQSSGVLLTRDHAGNDFFDLAGRRALIMGREHGGIDEVWIHPIRVMRDYEAGVVSGDSIAWLAHRPSTIEVRPESFTRKYTLPGATLTEVIFPSFTRAGGIAHYESSIPLQLVIRFRTDMRWMWPYDAGALGNLYYAVDQGIHALHVRDSSSAFACSFGADVAPVSLVAGQYASVHREG
jgi:hypothetical protein